MAELSQPPKEERAETEILLAQYEFARENRNSADASRPARTYRRKGRYRKTPRVTPSL